MTSVPQNDTGPEMEVRRLLHRMRYPCGLNRRYLRRPPKLVLGPRHTVVFVHSPWHGHECLKQRPATSHIAYWSEKVSKKRARDANNVRDLVQQGCGACVVPERETAVPEFLRQQIVRSLDGSPS